MLTASVVERRLGITRPAALAALRRLADLDILQPGAAGPRGQLRWQARSILDVLTEEQD